MSTKGLLIIIAALFECGWAYGLKHAGTPQEWLLTVVCVCSSFFIFMLAFKYVSVSLAYVLYTGLGTLFIVSAELIRSARLGEAVNGVQIFFIFTLMLGVMLIKGAKE